MKKIFCDRCERVIAGTAKDPVTLLCLREVCEECFEDFAKWFNATSKGIKWFKVKCCVDQDE